MLLQPFILAMTMTRVYTEAVESTGGEPPAPPDSPNPPIDFHDDSEGIPEDDSM